MKDPLSNYDENWERKDELGRKNQQPAVLEPATSKMLCRRSNLCATTAALVLKFERNCFGRAEK